MKTRKKSPSNPDSSDEDATEDEDDQDPSPFQCLFCNQGFAIDGTGLTNNLEHMRAAHGMFIPDPETMVDMESFVGYLATVVRAWHECLYCGAMKSSTLGIQSHMKDKGHCRLNLEREPELLEFWESPPSGDGEDGHGRDGPTTLSATEMRFASGKVIGSRHAAPATKKVPRKQSLALTTMGKLQSELDDAADSTPPIARPHLSSSRQLVRREEMGLVGISDQQRQALAVAEKKAQRSEAVARRVREWVYAKGANSQKFDQLDNQMKWGKQNHKLLPR